jgi:hypothetical protein
MTTDIAPSSAFSAPARAPRKKPGVLGRWRRRLSAVGSLFVHMKRTGRWWLAPMVVIFLAAALILAVVQVVEYAAPFVYTLF